MEHELPQLPEERILGGDPGTGQDVTIILVPKGGCKGQKLAQVHLHSNVLSTHSKYFNTCLSDRWTKSASLSSLEFALEVQVDVGYYFDCFSSMYSPFPKNRDFQGVKYGLELLKVASQIDHQELMDRILLYLSTIFWSDEDELRIREYSSSPDFPRNHAQELVARLGLDESEEERQKQLCDLIRQCIRTALLKEKSSTTSEACCTRAFFTELLQSKCGPSNLFRTVAVIVSREAKDIFSNIDKALGAKSRDPFNAHTSFEDRLEAMCWVLEALLMAQVAEELVQGIAHLDAIPKYIREMENYYSRFSPLRQKFEKLVLRMYQEVVDGHLLLRTPERMALFANWHWVGPRSTREEKESFDKATEKLFFTFPLKQQIELINLRKENFNDFISTSSLISILSKQSWPAIELERPTEDPPPWRTAISEL